MIEACGFVVLTIDAAMRAAKLNRVDFLPWQEFDEPRWGAWYMGLRLIVVDTIGL